MEIIIGRDMDSNSLSTGIVPILFSVCTSFCVNPSFPISSLCIVSLFPAFSSALCIVSLFSVVFSLCITWLISDTISVCFLFLLCSYPKMATQKYP